MCEVGGATSGEPALNGGRVVFAADWMSVRVSPAPRDDVSAKSMPAVTRRVSGLRRSTRSLTDARRNRSSPSVNGSSRDTRSRPAAQRAPGADRRIQLRMRCASRKSRGLRRLHQSTCGPRRRRGDRFGASLKHGGSTRAARIGAYRSVVFARTTVVASATRETSAGRQIEIGCVSKINIPMEKPLLYGPSAGGSRRPVSSRIQRTITTRWASRAANRRKL